MDIESKESTSSNRSYVQINHSYIKYGIYDLTAQDVTYDINLQKIENFDNSLYYQTYINDSMSDNKEILSRYNYYIEENVVLYGNEKIMELDEYDVLSIPSTSQLDYFINKMNIFPIVISRVGNAQIIDLLSREKIASIDISPYHRGYFSIYGKFIEFKQPMSSGMSGIYSFFNNEFIETDEDLGTSTFGKTYYILEDGGTLGKDSTIYVYYNSNGEEIYRTSEGIVMN